MKTWLPAMLLMAAIPAEAAQMSGGSSDLPFRCDDKSCSCKGPESSAACVAMASVCAGDLRCKPDGVCTCAAPKTALPPGFLGGPARREPDGRILPPPKQD